MSSRNREKFCLARPGENVECEKRSRPKSGTYVCKFCGRVMAPQLVDNLSDVIKTPNSEKKGNITFVRSETDTSTLLLKNHSDNKTANEYRSKFEIIFNKLNAGSEAVEDAMKYYDRYHILKAKKAQEENVKIQSFIKDGLIKAITMVVVKDKNIPYNESTFQKHFEWKLSDCLKERRKFCQIIGKEIEQTIDYDSKIRNICNALGIGEYAIQCMNIAPIVFDILEGRQNNTQIGVLIYFVCQHFGLKQVNDADFAKYCDSSIGTIKKVFKTEMGENHPSYKKILELLHK